MLPKILIPSNKQKQNRKTAKLRILLGYNRKPQDKQSNCGCATRCGDSQRQLITFSLKEMVVMKGITLEKEIKAISAAWVVIS